MDSTGPPPRLQLDGHQRERHHRKVPSVHLLQPSRASARPRLGRVIAWFVACLLATPSAWAQPRTADLERAEAKAIEAKAFFKSGLFARAADGFMQAYAISHRSEMMFNAARSYEEAQMPAESIALFEQYVKLPDTTEDGRRDAGQRILRQRKAMESKGLTPPPVPKPEPKPEPRVEPKPEPQPDPRHEKAQVAPVPVIVAPQSKPPERNRFVSWSLLGGGSLLTLIALGGYGDARTQVDKANQMDFGVANAATVYELSVQKARGQRNVDIFLGLVGVGLAGWGAWRLWGPPPKAEAATWVAPTLGSQGTGLAVGGRF